MEDMLEDMVDIVDMEVRLGEEGGYDKRGGNVFLIFYFSFCVIFYVCL